MSHNPIRWGLVGWFMTLGLLIATGCSRETPRAVAPVAPAPVVNEKRDLPVDQPRPKAPMVIGPSAVLREPMPDFTAGQQLRGAFRARLGARTHTCESVSFTPDGLHLVGSGHGPAILVWDLKTGEPSRRLTVFAPQDDSLLGTRCAVLAPDGRTLASIGRGKHEIWLWDLTTNTVRQRLKSPDGFQRGVFTCDGKTLFTSRYGNEVHRWDLTTGEEKVNSGKIVGGNLDGGLVVTPDGKTVVVGAEDGSLILLDGETLKEKKRIGKHKHSIHGLALSPDGKTLASVAFDDGQLKIWDLEKAAEIRTLKYDGLLTAVAFSPSGKFLAAGGSTVTLWDVKTGAEQDVLHGYSENVNDLAFSPDGRLLAGAPNSQRGVVVWDLMSSLEKRIRPRGERDQFLALASGGTRAVVSVQNKIEVRDLVSAKGIWTSPDAFITAFAFAPDGKEFALCKSGDKVTLHAGSGAVKATLDLGPSGVVKSLVYRPDGKRLAVSAGNVVQLWDLSAAKPRKLPFAEEQPGTVDALTFHPEGKMLAVAVGPTLRLINAETGKPAWTVPAHDGTITTFAFSADGGRLLTASRDGGGRAARLWQASDGKEIAVFRHDFRPYHAFFAPDGKTVVTLDSEGAFFAWDAGSGKQLGFLPGQKIESLPVFAPDHKSFLTAGAKTFHLWETAALTRAAILGRTDLIRTAPKSSTPARVYAPARAVLKGHRGSPRYCAFSADGKRLVSVDDERNVIVWNPTSGKAVKSLALLAADVLCYSLAPDGKRLAFGCRDQTVRLWNLETGKQEHLWKGHQSFVRCVAFSPDGRRVASGTDAVSQTELILWDVGTGAQIKKLTHGGSWPTNLAFSPDGKVLVEGSFNENLCWFDVESGTERPKLNHPETVNSVDVSPDGKKLAVGGGFSSLGLYDVTVWDMQSSKLLHTLTGNQVEIRGLAFGPDDLLVVDSRAIDLWDARTGKRIQHVPGGGPFALSPDGKTLAVTSREGLQLLDVAVLRDGRLQKALLPILELGGVATPLSDGVAIEISLPGGPDSIAALTALEGLGQLRSLKIKQAEMIPQGAVRALGKLKSLRSLAINSSDLRDDHLKMLADLAELTSLDLSDCRKVTGPGVAVLAKLSRLEELNLNSAPIAAADLQPLIGLKQLRSLNLRSTAVRSEGLEVLAKFPALTDLDLGYAIDDEGLAKLKAMKQLRGLVLQGGNISDAGAANLSGLTALKKLDLARTQVADAGLAHLKLLTNLEALDLSGTQAADAGFKHLAVLTKLTSIRLDNMEKLTGAGLAHLRGAAGLTELNLASGEVTDAGLAGLKDWTHLGELQLPDRITDAGLLHLVKLTNLRKINLSSLQKVKGTGLAGLKNATALKELDLSSLPVDDAGLEGIKEWKHLQVLKLPKRITDAGLARLTGLKALVVLHAGDAVGITNTGLAHLKGLTNLEEIDVNGTKITDAGLVSLEGLTKLRRLVIGSTGVTDAGAEKLKKKRPEVNVSRY